MIIHLDTNYLVRLKRHDSDEARHVRDWVKGRATFGTSSIAWTEFLCGPLDPGEPESVRTIVGMPLPFAEADAELAAELFNRGGRRRNSLADCQIAALAIRARASLATADRAGFARFAAAGLRLADE
ncbi:MAG: PIN domain-containing protein [Terriglobales bacterium]